MGTYKGVVKISVMLALTYGIAQGLIALLPAADYRTLLGLSNRTAVWVVAEPHLISRPSCWAYPSSP